MPDQFRHTTRPCNPTHALQKSLRLPRTYPRVAQWLFGKPHLAFHDAAPQLTPQAFSASLALRNHYVYEGIGGTLDPFGIDECIVEPVMRRSDVMVGFNSGSVGEQNVESCATITTDLLLTPVARAGHNVVVGYSNTTGEAFDPNRTRQQSGTFRGKSGLNGRFAYDPDNDHLIIVINSITPLVSGIIDTTFLGLARNRSCYTIPNAPYGPKRLPSKVLVLLTSVEVRTDLNHPGDRLPSPLASLLSTDLEESLSPSEAPGLQKFQSMSSVENCLNDTESNNLTFALSDRPSHTSLPPEISNKYADDIRELAEDMYNLTLNMQGVFKGKQMCREIFDPLKSGSVLSSATGQVTGVHALPTKAHRRQMVTQGWQVYSAWESSQGSQNRYKQRHSDLMSVDESMGHSLHSVRYLTWPGSKFQTPQPKLHRRDATIQTESSCKSDPARGQKSANPNVSLMDFSKPFQNEGHIDFEELDLDTMDEDAIGEERACSELTGSEELLDELVNWEAPTLRTLAEETKLNTYSKTTPKEKLTPVPLTTTENVKQYSGPASVLNKPLCHPLPGAPQVVLVPLLSLPIPARVSVVPQMEKPEIAEVPIGSGVVKDVQVCYSCKCFIGREKVVVADTEKLRVRKLEEKKRKNRESASRSNEKRRMREIAQRRELEERRKQVVELRKRTSMLKTENEFLRISLAKLGIIKAV